MSSFLYRHFDADGTLLYVGISNHVGRRTDDHSKHSGWFERISKIEVSSFETREEALNAERVAILSEQPLFNIHHKRKMVPPPPIEVTREGITRTVAVRPLYDPRGAAELLGLTAHRVRGLIEEGSLGSFILPPVTGKHPKTYITGWQIIDWLEHKMGL